MQNKNVKILSIIDSDKAYGKERANLEVIRILKENGAKVVLALNTIADNSITEEVRSFNTVKIPYPRHITGRFRSWRYIKAFFKTQMQFCRLMHKAQPDYVLVPTEIALTFLYFPFLSSKTQIVYRCGDSPLVFRKKGFLANVYCSIWRHLIVNRIDTLICNAKFIQRQNAEAGRKPNTKDKLIYNYPPKREVVSDDIEYRSCPDALKVGFMGRIVADKGVKELILAVLVLLKEGRNVILYIGGSPDKTEEYIDELDGILEQNTKYKSRIQFLGNVRDLSKFYRNVDFVAIPSIYPEPMANVVTEAKYHHRPVIIFNQGGMPEIVSHMTDGYICDEVSVEGLVKGLKYYLDNPQLVKEHGENAYKSIERLGLTKEKFTEKWLSVFGMTK